MPTAMNSSWTMANEAALALCRYYKGEDDCPFGPTDMASTFWDVERGWVLLVVGDETRQDNLLLPFLLDFGGGLDAFDVEVSLKAFLYDQFCHFGGSKGDFPGFLLQYLSGAPGS